MNSVLFPPCFPFFDCLLSKPGVKGKRGTIDRIPKQRKTGSLMLSVSGGEQGRKDGMYLSSSTEPGTAGSHLPWTLSEEPERTPECR